MWRKIAAFLGFALGACMIVVMIVDQYNPMMGFLRGQPMETYLLLLCLFCMAEALAIYFPSGRKKRSRGRHSRVKSPEEEE
ncbi:MAG: hypothetical protein IJE26_01340 [Oscillospiraceae bacterium]|nr:hypothetical protein [Oscillospiraceae bacterium]